MTAAGIALSWTDEMSARLPDLFASIISVALTYRLALSLWRRKRSVLLSTLMMALSPFGIAFAPTVFADPQLTMWLLASLIAVNSRKWGWGGVLYGLALATKQNAVFFAPMVLGCGLVRCVNRQTHRMEFLQWIGQFVVGASAVVSLLVLWDMNRHVSVDFWTAGIESNNPHRLIRSAETFSRIKEWWFSARYLAGNPATTGAIVVALLGQGLRDAKSARHTDRKTISALFLVTYLVAYLAMCWLVAFPVFDRYLLPILPIMAVLTGRTLDKSLMLIRAATTKQDKVITKVAPILLLAMLFIPAIFTSSNTITVGGDHGSYDGIDEIALYLHNEPWGTVLYYDSLGWTLQYYMFDYEIYLAPISSPSAIQDDLILFGHGSEHRYLVLPAWQSTSEIIASVTRSGYSAALALETRDRFGQQTFLLYRLSSNP